MIRHVLIFGLVGGLLSATLQYSEYRLVVIGHSIELDSAVIAILFATFGIWLGLRIARNRKTVMEEKSLAPDLARDAESVTPFAPDITRQKSLGITARELENPRAYRPPPQQSRNRRSVFVSENTVKTHCSRAFEKLGAARRTQAVRRGKELGLLP